MTIRSLAARGLSFAHLAGRSALASRAESDEEDDEKKDARRAESDDPEEQDRDDKDGKKGKRADTGDNEDESAEDDEDKKDDKAKGKKAKASDSDEADDEEDDESAEDDDDDDEEMRGKGAVARARRREQARCAAIMGSKAAGRNVELAANLAFKTRMTRQEALAILRSSPAAVSTMSRSARNPSLGAGGDLSGNSKAAASAGWDRAFSKQARTARR